MDNAEFTALVIANEININSLAAHFGKNKKYRWEEPLVLKEDNLAGIIHNINSKYVFVFYFGSIVLINFSHHEMMDLLKYLQRLDKNINTTTPFVFQDSINLQIQPDEPEFLGISGISAQKFQNFHLEIISIVLARSVALDKIEYETDKLLDDVEEIVELLHKGRFSISDRRLAKTSATILRFKYNSISYLMLLDKPEITWTNEDAGYLFTDLSELFELEERYQTLGHKSETLMDITQVFAGLTHASRDARLEWMIIILIALEIVLSILDRIF